jgi:hypothetical protein
MSSHDPYRLYDFLRVRAVNPSGADKSWELMPGIADSLKYLTELVVSKETMQEGSPWQVRFHQYAREGTTVEASNNPEVAAENYNACLGSTAMGARQIFGFDRPLTNSPTGASNLRLEIQNTRVGQTGDGRSTREYALTTYSPRTLQPKTIKKPFDNDEYDQVKAHIAAGTLDIWDAQQEAALAVAIEPIKPLPSIHPLSIYSQFILRRHPTGKGQQVYTATFKPSPSNTPARLTTPIDADYDQIEAAYAPPMLPRLTPTQIMVHSRGAHTLVHHNLSVALRDLAGE